MVELDLDFFRVEPLNLFLDLGEHVSLLLKDVGLGACADFRRNFTTEDSRQFLSVVFVCCREILFVLSFFVKISLSERFLVGRDRNHRLDLDLVIVKIVDCVLATVHLTLCNHDLLVRSSLFISLRLLGCHRGETQLHAG